MVFNILTDEFFINLYYVIYKGPPSTIYEKYENIVDTEESIIKAIKKCGSRLFQFIVNPSDNVINETLKVSKVPSFIFDKLKNPSKQVIQTIIELEGSYYQQYKNLFNENETMKLLEKNPSILKNIEKPTYLMNKVALSNNGLLIEYIDEQTEELCEIAIRNIYDNQYSYINNVVSKIKYFNDNIVDMIVSSPLAKQFYNIPESYHNLRRVLEAVNFNPHIIINIKDEYKVQELYDIAFKSDINIIQYIPKKFQTDEMVNILKKHSPDFSKYSLYSRMLKYLKCSNIDTYMEIMNYDANNIVNVPYEYQTIEMCVEAIKKYYENLAYCRYITSGMISDIFNSNYLKHIPKNRRMIFINDFNEKIQIKIVSVCPDLLRYISNQTPNIINAALSSDGFALQYVKNKTPEFIKKAIDNEPRAIKYA